MRKIFLFLSLVISTFILVGCNTLEENVNQSNNNQGATKEAKPVNKSKLETLNQEIENFKKENPSPAKVATVEMEKGGTFKLALLSDVAPKTVANFEKKANGKFYDGLTFHRVEDWVVQGGDPLGNGTGGGNMETEINKRSFIPGSLGVARGGDIKISNDSQFFINTTDASFLNEQYTNFGQLIEGADVVLGIQIGDKIKSIHVQ